MFLGFEMFGGVRFLRGDHCWMQLGDRGETLHGSP